MKSWGLRRSPLLQVIQLSHGRSEITPSPSDPTLAGSNACLKTNSPAFRSVKDITPYEGDPLSFFDTFNISGIALWSWLAYRWGQVRWCHSNKNISKISVTWNNQGLLCVSFFIPAGSPLARPRWMALTCLLGNVGKHMEYLVSSVTTAKRKSLPHFTGTWWQEHGSEGQGSNPTSEQITPLLSHSVLISQMKWLYSSSSRFTAAYFTSPQVDIFLTKEVSQGNTGPLWRPWKHLG
jgi:hypothetical protein